MIWSSCPCPGLMGTLKEVTFFSETSFVFPPPSEKELEIGTDSEIDYVQDVADTDVLPEATIVSPKSNTSTGTLVPPLSSFLIDGSGEPQYLKRRRFVKIVPQDLVLVVVISP
eukprot:Selendium_serpulae@DN9327_c0_g1_i1.p1